MKDCEIRLRVATLRAALEKEKVDAAVVTVRPNSFYFSGFPCSNSLILILQDRGYFLTDFRYLSKASKCIQHLEVHDIGKFDISAIVDGSAYVGYEGESAHSSVESLKRRLPRRKFKNISAVIRSIRNIKSKSEIKFIAENQALTESILSNVLQEVCEGVREDQLRILIRQLQIAHRADEAFDSIVAVGANSANPHAIAGANLVRSGKLLLIDMGTRRSYYYSDMTRTYAVGTIPPKARQIYDIVLEAQLAALDAIRPGAAANAIDAVARNIITKAGYGDMFGHGLGHGVGLEIHEGPTLRKESKDVLQEGMVVTVEPGIYLPGFGGVRIEDTVVVMPKGCRNLNTMPKTLSII